ncbi:MAG: response regulator [Phycisphaerales bacterium]|nr:MAG: response regulator [Phycisphaerales bacterium]
MRLSPKILVVDDEPDLIELVSYNLSQAGYEVFRACNGFEAIEVATKQKPNLILLDVMMPEIQGTEVARRLRADPRTGSIPIIMLTARASEADQLTGLSVGADDYVVKPFSIKVLLARIDAVLRRVSEGSAPEGLTIGDVRLDLDSQEVFVADESAQFTPTEFRLLAALIQANGRTLTREDLVRKGMGPGVTVTDRAIDVHIAAVRRKLGDRAGLVQTVRGAGYRIGNPGADTAHAE